MFMSYKTISCYAVIFMIYTIQSSCTVSPSSIFVSPSFIPHFVYSVHTLCFVAVYCGCTACKCPMFESMPFIHPFANHLTKEKVGG